MHLFSSVPESTSSCCFGPNYEKMGNFSTAHGTLWLQIRSVTSVTLGNILDKTVIANMHYCVLSTQQGGKGPIESHKVMYNLKLPVCLLTNYFYNRSKIYRGSSFLQLPSWESLIPSLTGLRRKLLTHVSLML